MIENTKKVRFFPRNPHLQTVLRSFRNESARYAESNHTFRARDGEPLHVDLRIGRDRATQVDVPPDGTFVTKGGAWVVLLHGLEGSTTRPYMVAMSNGLTRRGFRVAALNFRGCGGRVHRSRESYHAGRIEDLEDTIRWLRATVEPERLHLAGFSLGGSVVIHLLARSPLARGITSAAAVSPPLDLHAASTRLETGLGKLYTAYFLRSLRRKVNHRAGVTEDGVGGFTGSTLRDFDEQITAPIHGFESAEEYYRRCSAGCWLDKIDRSLLLVHALDDPICPLPVGIHDELNRHASVRAVLTRSGGHVAFLESTGEWLPGRVAKHFEE